ncbi:MAG TPA: helix-turn-helix domain-containing protein [Blastocatellia bacterium]|nr:helix-turn-helix domain-containing protein [Blastocatellia bacterium]
MKRRRTEITVETSLLVWRRVRRGDPLTCAACPQPSPLIAPEEAAALAGTSTRTIYRWVEAGRLHFAETADGRLLVCPHTLPISIYKEQIS